MTPLKYVCSFKNIYFHPYITILIFHLPVINEAHLNKTLNLAVLSPWTQVGIYLNLQATAAIVVALEDIYASGLLPSSYKVNWTWRDTGCSNPQATIELEKLYATFNGELHGILGDVCSSVCQTAGLLAAAWNVPIISFLCTLTSLSDKTIYPTFARVGGTTATVIPIAKHFFKYFNWTRIAIISDATPVHSTASDSYAEILKNSGNIVYRYTVATVYDTGTVIVPYIKPFLQVLNDIKSKARGMLFMTAFFI